MWGCCWIRWVVLVTEDIQKEEFLNAFFASIFTAKDSPWGSQTSEVREGQRREDFPLIVEGWVRGRLDRFHTHKSMCPGAMHPWVLRELKDVVAPLLSVIFEKSWEMGEMPDDWRKGKVAPIYQEGKNDWQGESRLYNSLSLKLSSSFCTPEIYLWVVSFGRKKKSPEEILIRAVNSLNG